MTLAERVNHVVTDDLCTSTVSMLRQATTPMLRARSKRAVHGTRAERVSTAMQ